MAYRLVCDYQMTVLFVMLSCCYVGGSYIDITTEEEFEEEVLHSKLPVVVEFYARYVYILLISAILTL